MLLGADPIRVDNLVVSNAIIDNQYISSSNVSHFSCGFMFRQIIPTSWAPRSCTHCMDSLLTYNLRVSEVTPVLLKSDFPQDNIAGPDILSFDPQKRNSVDFTFQLHFGALLSFSAINSFSFVSHKTKLWTYVLIIITTQADELGIEPAFFVCALYSPLCKEPASTVWYTRWWKKEFSQAELCLFLFLFVPFSSVSRSLAVSCM